MPRPLFVFNEDTARFDRARLSDLTDATFTWCKAPSWEQGTCSTVFVDLTADWHPIRVDAEGRLITAVREPHPARNSVPLTAAVQQDPSVVHEYEPPVFTHIRKFTAEEEEE